MSDIIDCQLSLIVIFLNFISSYSDIYSWYGTGPVHTAHCTYMYK